MVAAALLHTRTSWRVTPDSVISRPVDMDARMKLISLDHSIKGVFLQNAAETLTADDVEKLKLQMSAPPKGAWIAFHDYPLRDLLRLQYAAAVKKFPGMPLLQAVRLYSRGNTEAFAHSMVGGVIIRMA